MMTERESTRRMEYKVCTVHLPHELVAEISVTVKDPIDPSFVAQRNVGQVDNDSGCAHEDGIDTRMDLYDSQYMLCNATLL